MKKLNVGCGDWGLGWGFGGHNKIGRLTKLAEGKYSWTGHQQGRHGHKLTKRYTVTFDYQDNMITNIEGEYSLPVRSELLSAIKDIERIE